MSFGDQFMLALCAWRENRSGQQAGMQSVMNVVMNRVAANGTSAYVEVVKPLQFSSITATGDPQLGLFPASGDVQWGQAQELSQQALAGTLEDITEGATNYYAAGTPIPYWAASMTQTVIVAGQIFFK